MGTGYNVVRMRGQARLAASVFNSAVTDRHSRKCAEMYPRLGRHLACVLPLVTALSLAVWTMLSATAIAQSESLTAASHMTLLQHAHPTFRAGLARHGLLADSGTRLHNTGMVQHQFGEQWENSTELAEARQSGRPYYFDRLTGGMPFQSLAGIEPIAEALRNDDLFLGFQIHEWGNSPIHDYERIHKLILDPGQPLDAEHFSKFEGRTESPYFSGGDYSIYRDVFRTIKTQADMESYLASYFQALVARTRGQVLSVTGYGQLQHAAFKLGAKNVMSEIGQQVPLTPLQLAFARGAGREYGRPFGVYYEPWGGTPMGCYCATPFSTWFPNHPQIREQMDGYRIGPTYGSSRSLQRRLLWYSWLAGATYWAEEWGAENYFSNWDDYPLTEYGRIMEEFIQYNRRYPLPRPLVPVALVMPVDTFGVDIRFVAGQAEQIWRMVPPDLFHEQLRALASQVWQSGGLPGKSEGRNLTPSPWSNCFDVLSAEAQVELLESYELVVYFDEQQAAASSIADDRKLVFDARPETSRQLTQRLQQILPYHVSGQVGAAQATSGDRRLVGVFNNVGVDKSVARGETTDPAALQTVVIEGVCQGMSCLVGTTFIVEHSPTQVTLRIPAGELAVLSFPQSP